MSMHLDRLARLQRAEDFFTFFSVEYDPQVLSVYRLRILKRFGLEVAAIDAGAEPLPEDERARRYARALAVAHAQYAARMAGPDREPAAAACLPAACPGCPSL